MEHLLCVCRHAHPRGVAQQNAGRFHALDIPITEQGADVGCEADCHFDLLHLNRVTCGCYGMAATNRFAWMPSTRREIPLKRMPKPTRVPITQTAELGRCIQINTASSRETIASNNIHPLPWR